ncbi:MAG TPA: helix-turn-helix transcriptional regulator, partial [Leclercia adecarboxylata]|nr:helix-turn-helix transcriptional regulator [Leclercia adecarboxylata]
LQADFAASCIWSSLSNTSRHGVSWNIDDKAMREHASTWQYIDPITPLLRAKQRPTLVDEVMPARELYKTPFYQHFLKPCGMHHGVNVYFIREGEDVGDLRIWRAKGAPPFGQREIALLQLLEPWFARALPKDDASPALTAREQEVVNLVSKGLGDKEVARLLNISFTTVRTHLNHALKKLDCANRTELASRFRH